MVGHQLRNVEYSSILTSARSEAKRSTFWLSLLIGVLTVLVIAAAFNVPLEGWRSSSTAVISAHTVDAVNSVFFTSIAGVLVGAFFGFYAAKRIVKRRKKLLTERAVPRDRLGEAGVIGPENSLAIRRPLELDT